ncbi:phage major capsid protein, partial [Terrabacter terrigena]
MNLKQMRAAALKAAQDLIEGAKAAARDLTKDEQAQVEAKFAEIRELDERIKAAEGSDALMAQLAGLGGGQADDEKDGDEVSAKSLGEFFAKSIGQEGLTRLKGVRGTSLSTAEFKANTDPQLTPSAFGPVLTQVDRTVVPAFRRATVSDLLGVGNIGAGSNAITYFVEGAAEGNFATVAEGGQKPQLHIADPVAKTDAAKKIAGWWDTADEMIEDLDFWVSEINNRGLYLLSLVEESQVLNGDGTGSNVLGLLNRSGIQTETQAATGDSAQDAIFRAMTKVQTATGLQADAIIINPADYQALRLSKDGNGQYYGGGFFSGLYGVGGVEFQPPVWGLKTVVSAAVAPKTVVVGALKASTTLYRKGGVRVESTNSDASKFTKDIVTTRIEERIALAN